MSHSIKLKIEGREIEEEEEITSIAEKYWNKVIRTDSGRRNR